jgi:guanylate kinase
MNLIKVIILCAPSGGGKGTSTNYIMEKYPDQFTVSVSATTRNPGSNEVHGIDYYFLSPEEFREKIRNDELLEHKEVYTDKFYGTLRSEVGRAASEGKILILDIDIEGAKDVKEKLGDAAKLLFIDAGDDEKLYETRIRERARSSDTEQAILERIAKVPAELSEGRRMADGVIKNQGTLAEYHAEIQKCLLENGLIDNNDEKKSELKSPFKLQ